LLSVCSGAGNQKEAVVMEDIAAVACSALGAIADPHANGSLFVGGVTAPVDFIANAASAVFGNATKAVVCDSLSLGEVDNGGLVGIGVMD